MLGIRAARHLTGGRFGEPKLDLSGCVLNTQLWRPDQVALSGSTFNSHDAKVCTNTGAVWTPRKGYSFDGGDDYIAVTQHSAFPYAAAARSAEAWIYPETIDAVDRRAIFSWGQSGILRALFELNLLNITGGLVLSTWGDDSIGAGMAPTLNAWNYVAVTYDGNVTSKVYMNNATETRVHGAVLATVESNIDIGRRIASTQWFDGFIGEVRVYNRVLSPVEIARHQQQSRWRYF